MKELVTYQANNPYALALQSTKIAEMKKTDAMGHYLDLISKTYYDSGQTMPGNDQRKQKENLQMLAGALHEELKQFHFIRIEELKICFANGVRGEYGEYFGINVKTFYQWIKGWIGDEKRKSALLMIKQSKEREYKPVMTESEAEYGYKLALQNQFTTYKETGVLVILFPVRVFLDFESRGMIELSKEQKQVIYDKAKYKYVESLRVQRTHPKDSNHSRELSSMINRIETEAEVKSDTLKIKSMACEMAVKQFYDSITELVFNK